jgi:hypothetical protein
MVSCIILCVFVYVMLIAKSTGLLFWHSAIITVWQSSLAVIGKAWFADA